MRCPPASAITCARARLSCEQRHRGSSRPQKQSSLGVVMRSISGGVGSEVGRGESRTRSEKWTSKSISEPGEIKATTRTRAWRSAGEAVEQERQHVGAHRVTGERDLLAIPGAETVAKDALEIARGLVGGAAVPEVAERAQDHRRDTVLGQLLGQQLIGHVVAG